MELHARMLAALIVVAAAILPAGAFAQIVPAPPQSDAGPLMQPEGPPPPPHSEAPPPSYSMPHPPPNPGEETIHGRIVSFDGAYNLQVNDDRGFVDNVRMHQGTIINPTGLTLAPGMVVTIYGANSGSVFAAHQIDTPYQSYGYAYPVYPYPVYPFYGYPFYGYPYPFGARVFVGFGFGFGFGYHPVYGGYGGYHGHR